jgi:hypothetical protein
MGPLLITHGLHSMLCTQNREASCDIIAAEVFMPVNRFNNVVTLLVSAGSHPESEICTVENLRWEVSKFKAQC